MKVYSHPRCTTCKKALAFLAKQGAKPQIVDITEQAPSKQELKKMLAYYGNNIRKLFNTSGIQYRELGLSEKLDEMSEEKALGLLAENGMLVKRPFLLTKNSGLVGFQEADWKKRATDTF